MERIHSEGGFIASPTNDLMVHSQYAKICSMIVKKLYSPVIISSDAVFEENQCYLKSLLDEWQQAGSKVVNLARTTPMSPSLSPIAGMFSQNLQLCSTLQYSEAIFTLYQQ
jgi:hypothetical protein